MGKAVKTFLTFIGVWFISSLLNGFLSGISISIINARGYIDPSGVMFMSLVFSFIFSTPLVGFVWLTTAIAQANGKSGHDLFQIILTTAFFCGVAGALFFINALGNEFKEAKYVTGLCIIVSALGGVLAFRNTLKAA